MSNLSKTFTFNSTAPVLDSWVAPEFSPESIEATPVLRQASLDKASLFGGPVVRSLLEAVPLKGDRSHIIVDSKVTLLMKGWYPAIPGWHTDGVPRGSDLNPGGKGEPHLEAQEGEGPRYHVITVGLDSPTQFLKDPLSLTLEHYSDRDLYKEMTSKVSPLVEDGQLETVAHHGSWVSWDWWNIHRAVPALEGGWRLLIRVTESDQIVPRTEDFIRSQSQVYVPVEFGW